MSNTFNPEIIVHNGEGLTLTARPSQSIFAGTNGDVDLELKFKDGDIDGNNEVKYKNAEIGRNEISDDVFMRTKTPMIVEPSDGSIGWKYYVKISELPNIVNIDTIEIEISESSDFSVINNRLSINLQTFDVNGNSDDFNSRTIYYLRPKVTFKNGVKMLGNSIRVKSDRVIKARDKEHLIRLINDDSLYLFDIDTSSLTDLSRLFYSKDGRKNITRTKTWKGFESWDVSNVKNFSFCFGHESVESFFGDSNYHVIDGWNVSSGVNFSGMFMNCSKLNFVDKKEIYKITQDDVLRMEQDGSLRPIPLDEYIDGFMKPATRGNYLNDLDFSSAEDMSYMFAFSCGKMYNDRNGVKIDKWNVSNVKDFSYMFKGFRETNFYGELTTRSGVPGESNPDKYIFKSWDMRNAENIRGMFMFSRCCFWLGVKNMPKVTDWTDVYNNVENYNTRIDHWPESDSLTGNVTTFTRTFFGAVTSNTSFNLKLDTRSAKNFDYCFAMSNIFNSFKTYADRWNMNNVLSAKFMFANGSYVDAHGSYYTKISRYTIENIGNWNMCNVEDITFMFLKSQMGQMNFNWNISKTGVKAVGAFSMVNSATGALNQPILGRGYYSSSYFTGGTIDLTNFFNRSCSADCSYMFAGLYVPSIGVPGATSKEDYDSYFDDFKNSKKYKLSTVMDYSQYQPDGMCGASQPYGLRLAPVPLLDDIKEIASYTNERFKNSSGEFYVNYEDTELGDYNNLNFRLALQAGFEQLNTGYWKTDGRIFSLLSKYFYAGTVNISSELLKEFDVLCPLIFGTEYSLLENLYESTTPFNQTGLIRFMLFSFDRCTNMRGIFMGNFATYIDNFSFSTSSSTLNQVTDYSYALAFRATPREDYQEYETLNNDLYSKLNFRDARSDVKIKGMFINNVFTSSSYKTIINRLATLKTGNIDSSFLFYGSIFKTSSSVLSQSDSTFMTKISVAHAMLANSKTFYPFTGTFNFSSLVEAKYFLSSFNSYWSTPGKIDNTCSFNNWQFPVLVDANGFFSDINLETPNVQLPSTDFTAVENADYMFVGNVFNNYGIDTFSYSMPSIKSCDYMFSSVFLDDQWDNGPKVINITFNGVSDEKIKKLFKTGTVSSSLRSKFNSTTWQRFNGLGIVV